MRDDYYKDLVADLIEQRAAKDIAAIVDQVRQQLSGLPDPRERVASVVQNLAGIDGDVRGVADRLAREASFLGNGGDETAAELMRNASCAISEHLVAVENRVMLLLADAFAAFTTGPAYACAALLFRLDPQSCQALGRPGDLERAEVIFSVLDEMNRVHLAPPAFDFHELVTDLRRFWHAVVSAAGLEEYVASEPFDAVRVLAAFRDVAIKSTAEYSKRDWKRARVLSTDWLTAVKDGDEPAVPERIGDFRLRDALNSAWASRLRLMVDLPPQERDKAKLLVEAVARKMCDDIIARSEPGTDPNPTYGKAQRPTGTGV